jgi:hypothetical protein
VVCLWRTLEFRQFHSFHGQAGPLITVGDPVSTDWYCEGRTATRREVEDAVRTGLPALRALCDQDEPGAHDALDAALARAQQYWPSETP